MLFNVASLFGWATVLMTYFRVNYYLSYFAFLRAAAGDQVPKPPFCLYAVAIFNGGDQPVWLFGGTGSMNRRGREL